MSKSIALLALAFVCLLSSTSYASNPDLPERRYKLDLTLEELKWLAEKGNKEAQISLGRAIWMNLGEFDDALAWLRKAAATGDKEALYELSNMLDLSCSEAHLQESLLKLSIAARMGSQRARNSLKNQFSIYEMNPQPSKGDPVNLTAMIDLMKEELSILNNIKHASSFFSITLAALKNGQQDWDELCHLSGDIVNCLEGLAHEEPGFMVPAICRRYANRTYIVGTHVLCDTDLYLSLGEKNVELAHAVTRTRMTLSRINSLLADLDRAFTTHYQPFMVIKISRALALPHGHEREVALQQVMVFHAQYVDLWGSLRDKFPQLQKLPGDFKTYNAQKGRDRIEAYRWHYLGLDRGECLPKGNPILELRESSQYKAYYRLAIRGDLNDWYKFGMLCLEEAPSWDEGPNRLAETAAKGYLPSMIAMFNYYCNKRAPLDALKYYTSILTHYPYLEELPEISAAHDLSMFDSQFFKNHLVLSLLKGYAALAGKPTDEARHNALLYFEDAVSRGYKPAYLALARLYKEHYNNSQDAYSLICKAAARDLPVALSIQGDCLLRGEGVEPNPTKGRALIEEAYKLKDYMAVLYRARMHRYERYGFRDKKTAIHYYREAERWFPIASVELGDIFEGAEGWWWKGIGEGKDGYEKAAKKKNPEGQFKLALQEHKEIQYSEWSFEWALKAAHQGHLEAMSFVSKCLLSRHIYRDPVAAFSWMMRGAQAGHRGLQAQMAEYFKNQYISRGHSNDKSKYSLARALQSRLDQLIATDPQMHILPGTYTHWLSCMIPDWRKLNGAWRAEIEVLKSKIVEVENGLWEPGFRISCIMPTVAFLDLGGINNHFSQSLFLERCHISQEEMGGIIYFGEKAQATKQALGYLTGCHGKNYIGNMISAFEEAHLKLNQQCAFVNPLPTADRERYENEFQDFIKSIRAAEKARESFEFEVTRFLDETRPIRHDIFWKEYPWLY